MTTEREAEAVAEACVVIEAFLEFSRRAAWLGGYKTLKRVMSEGPDRYVLDQMHRDEERYAMMKAGRVDWVVKETARVLMEGPLWEVQMDYGSFWQVVIMDFLRKYRAGEISLFEIHWL